MESLGPVPTFLFGLLAVVGTVLLLAIWVPIRFTAEGLLTSERIDGHAYVAWGGRILTVEAGPVDGIVVRGLGLRLYKGPLSSAEEKQDEAKVDTPRKKRWRPRARFLIRVVRRALPTLRLHANVRGRLGTGDPADTAAVHGLVAAARSWCPGIDTRSLTIDWLEPSLDLEGSVSGRVWPAALLWVVASEFIQARFTRRHQGVFG